jgi:hypothetical protein
MVLVDSCCVEASGRWKVFEYFCLVDSGVGSGFRSWLLGIKIDFTTSGFRFWAYWTRCFDGFEGVY